MPQQIKISDSAYQESLVTLNGNSLRFTFSYNTRDGRWYFDIVDRNGNDVLSGIKVLPYQNLTDYIPANTLLDGALFCVNTRISDAEITRDNFGTDNVFQLWYLTSEEIDVLLEG